MRMERNQVMKLTRYSEGKKAKCDTAFAWHVPPQYVYRKPCQPHSLMHNVGGGGGGLGDGGGILNK